MTLWKRPSVGADVTQDASANHTSETVDSPPLSNKELLWEGAQSPHSISGTPNAVSGKSNSIDNIPTESDSVKNEKATHLPWSFNPEGFPSSATVSVSNVVKKLWKILKQMIKKK